MTRLSEIPVHVEGRSNTEKQQMAYQPVLLQVRDALATLAHAGTPGIIDLRNQPRIGPAAYQTLKQVLGTGEVTMVVKADVTIEISETAHPGVWWTTHRNEHGAIVTELIEVTELPAILRPHRAEIRAGLSRLEQAIEQSAQQLEAPPALN